MFHFQVMILLKHGISETSSSQYQKLKDFTTFTQCKYLNPHISSFRHCVNIRVWPFNSGRGSVVGKIGGV